MKSLLLILMLLISTSSFAKQNSYFNYTKIKILNENNHEIPASGEILENLKNAEATVMGDLKERCFEIDGTFYNKTNNSRLSDGIVIMEPDQNYKRKISNGKIMAKNIGLAPFRFFGKVAVKLVYITDKTFTGYETLKGASKNTFNPNKLKHAYNIRLSENEQDWVHIYKTKGEYIAKAYVSNTPESMESFMREFFRKGAGCNSLPKIGE